MQFLRRILSIFLRISISIVMLVLLFKITKIDTASLLQHLKTADKRLLSLAFVTYFLTYVLCLFRWRMLLKGAGIDLPLRRLIISFSGGTFFSIFLPSTIGGDFMRSADLAVYTKKTKEVIATVFLDRLSGYIGLVILVLLSLLFGWKLVEDSSVIISIAVITGLLVSILLVLFNNFLYLKITGLLNAGKAGRIREAIRRLHHEIYIFRHQKKIILNNLILSFIVQAVTPLTFFLIALSLGIKVKIIYFFVFLPIIGAITLLPISIGGLGLRETSTVFYFSKIGVDEHLSLAMSLLSFSFILIYGALGGIIYALTIRHRRIQHNKPSSV